MLTGGVMLQKEIQLNAETQKAPLQKVPFSSCMSVLLESLERADFSVRLYVAIPWLYRGAGAVPA